MTPAQKFIVASLEAHKAKLEAAGYADGEIVIPVIAEIERLQSLVDADYHPRPTGLGVWVCYDDDDGIYAMLIDKLLCDKFAALCPWIVKVYGPIPKGTE